MIEAAGGVVWRRAGKRTEVLLIHRPRYSDWSLPKGKLELGEDAAECALREVREETGLRCGLGATLPDVRYIDRKGRRKRVRYWAMQVHAGSFAPNREVDKIRWLAVDAAMKKLSYRHDTKVLKALGGAGIPS